jgi:hypothetical protein
MRRVLLALFCGLLGILLIGACIPSKLNGQAEISTEKLVNTLRLLNTQEYVYQHESGRFATQTEMLSFLRTKGILSKAPVDLENPKPYELAITTSLDGKHYQITLKPLSGMNNEGTGCRTAAFSDDAGLIFLGSALGCEASTR